MRLLVWLACAWGAGIILEQSLGGRIHAWLIGIVLGAAATLVAIKTRVGVEASIVLLACSAGGFASAGERRRAAADTGLAVPDGETVVVEGIVARPQEATHDGRRTLIDLDRRVVKDGSRRVAARVMATETSDRPIERAPPAPGDRVRFAGVVRRTVGYRNEGAFDRPRSLAGQGISALVAVRPPGLIPVPPRSRRPLWKGVAKVRERLSPTFAGEGDGAALVRALVLGDRSGVRPTVDDAFRRAGLAHLLSISGLHLAAVAMVLFAAVRRGWLRSAALTRHVPPEWIAVAFAFPVALVYTLVTGATVATVRAMVGVTIVMAGAVLARRVDALTALAAAALVLLVDSPWTIFEPSFQLSFAAAAALATLAARWGGVPPVRGRGRRLLAAGRRLLAASAAAAVATAPLTALHFGAVQPAGVVTNFVFVPLTELVVLPLGLAAAAIGAAVPALGRPLADVASGAAEVLVSAVLHVGEYSPVFEVPPPSPVELIALLFALLSAAKIQPPRRALWHALFWTSLAVGSLLVTTRLLPATRTDLRVTFLDVGQGDSAVIEVPGGEVWLVDAGGRLFGSPEPDADRDEQLAARTTDPGERAVWPFLRTRRVRRLDVVVISHPHPDHYGGLAALASHLPIGEIWVTGEDPGDPRWTALLEELARRDVRIVRPTSGLARERYGARIDVLAPGADASGQVAADPYRSVNDNSLVVRVAYAGRSILFTGDLEAEGEAALVASAPAELVDVDVVKVPHHGSRTSSSPALIAATTPSLVVVSCGRANRFGFPVPEVLARWEAARATIARTDRDGAVTVTITQAGALLPSSFAL